MSRNKYISLFSDPLLHRLYLDHDIIFYFQIQKKIGKVLNILKKKLWKIENYLTLYPIGYVYTTFTNFSMKYLVMCMVYTDDGGIK